MTEITNIKQTHEHGFDNGSISVSSTTSEDYTSDQEFEVERILAEKYEGGRKYHLVFWSRYPEEKSTWEPRKKIPKPGNPSSIEGQDVAGGKRVCPGFHLGYLL